MALKKRDARNARGEGVDPGKPKGVWAKYPLAWEWFSSTTYDDGSPRTLPTINQFLDAGCLKAFFNDKDQGLSVCLTSDSFEGLLAALEDGLKADCLEWRQSGPPKKSRK